MMDATLSNNFPREFLPVVESVRRCPEHYALCPKGDCAKASCCLRAQMYREKADRDFLTLVNPAKLANIKGECPYFRDSEPRRYALGFRRAYDSIEPPYRRPRFRNAIEDALDLRKSSFYNMLNGERLISPQEQRAIIAEAEKLHIPFGQDSFTTFFLAPEW
ncbi:MAG: hypothetical protein KBT29_07255 [Prevotellaceae bacterium]|nr:hypothetical protein [Candidatus Minthosoma caballi]